MLSRLDELVEAESVLDRLLLSIADCPDDQVVDWYGYLRYFAESLWGEGASLPGRFGSEKPRPAGEVREIVRKVRAGLGDQAQK